MLLNMCTHIEGRQDLPRQDDSELDCGADRLDALPDAEVSKHPGEEKCCTRTACLAPLSIRALHWSFITAVNLISLCCEAHQKLHLTCAGAAAQHQLSAPGYVLPKSGPEIVWATPSFSESSFVLMTESKYASEDGMGRERSGLARHVSLPAQSSTAQGKGHLHPPPCRKSFEDLHASHA